jgi:hypothetical protein
MPLRLTAAEHHGSALISPAARSVFVQASRSLHRDATAVARPPRADGGNKQGTSNRGTQPPSTTFWAPRIHTRSGQPLAVTLNGTVRVLTYKQEAGGSSPSPPILESLQISRFALGFGGCDRVEWAPGTSNSSLRLHTSGQGHQIWRGSRSGAVGVRGAGPATVVVVRDGWATSSSARDQQGGDCQQQADEAEQPDDHEARPG